MPLTQKLKSLGLVESLRLDKRLSAVFAVDGSLLWRSPLWSGCKSSHCDGRVLGFGWLEFVEPQDVPRLLRFFANPAAQPPITFSAMAPTSGKRIRVTYAKTHCPVGWIVVGTFSIDENADCSAMSCAAGMLTLAAGMMLIEMVQEAGGVLL